MTNPIAQHAMDWRAQLAKNDRRTRGVIVAFIAIYLVVGLLIDVVVDTYTYHAPPGVILQALLTFKLMPVFTFIMGLVAAVSLWVTYAFYDRIILMGTEYQEITPENVTTLDEKQLYHVIEELRLAAGLKFMPRVFIINADYMNAFASGYSEKSAMVAITRGLLEKLDRAELQAVMAHELSHIRHHDIKLTLTATVLSNIMLLAIDMLFYNVLYARGDEREERGAGALLLVVMILRLVLPIITMLLTFYLSRTREYMADAGCVELMRDNIPLARALTKIDEDHQANADVYRQEYDTTSHEDVRRAAYLYDPVQAGIEPMTSVANLFSTHPTIANRLRALGFVK